MAKNYRYFTGDVLLDKVGHRQIDSGRYELYGVDPDKPLVWNGTKFVGFVKVERTVIFKSNPSRHDCDARCQNASGRTMNCECACGGKNHGKASFACK